MTILTSFSCDEDYRCKWGNKGNYEGGEVWDGAGCTSTSGMEETELASVGDGRSLWTKSYLRQLRLHDFTRRGAIRSGRKAS